MARFDIYNGKETNALLLDVQSDLLQGLQTRVVVPLLPRDTAPKPADRLNPVFRIGDAEVVMTTQFLAAVPFRELGDPVAHLRDREFEIGAALDMLFIGF